MCFCRECIWVRLFYMRVHLHFCFLSMHDNYRSVPYISYSTKNGNGIIELGSFELF